jgi:uncharacterized membrane protein HdeD (DUF308 family)
MHYPTLIPPRLAQLGSFRPIQPGSDYTEGANIGKQALSNLELILSNVIGIMTVLGGMFFLFQFIFAAFTWVTSGGEKGKLESARGKMLHSTIGLIILITAYTIVGLIGMVVGLDLLSPATVLQGLIP